MLSSVSSGLSCQIAARVSNSQAAESLISMSGVKIDQRERRLLHADLTKEDEAAKGNSGYNPSLCSA